MVEASQEATFSNEVHQFRHLGRDAHDTFDSRLRAYFAARRLDFSCAGSWLRAHSGWKTVQFVKVDGLADKIVSSQLERGLHIIELRIGGDHDDGAGVAALLELIEHFDAGQVGQAHVQQHQVGVLALRQQRRLAGVGFDHGVSPLFTFLAQRPAHQALVVDDHDFLCRHACLIYYEIEGTVRVTGSTQW